MIVLFSVGLTSITIFQGDGLQQDALSMKTSTKGIMTDSDDKMKEFME